MKIKHFISAKSQSFEKKINDFLKDKRIKDVKYTTLQGKTNIIFSALVVYED